MMSSAEIREAWDAEFASLFGSTAIDGKTFTDSVETLADRTFDEQPIEDQLKIGRDAYRRLFQTVARESEKRQDRVDADDQLTLFIAEPDHVVLFDHKNGMRKAQRYLTNFERRQRADGLMQEANRVADGARRHAEQENEIADMLEGLGFDTYDAYEKASLS